MVRKFFALDKNYLLEGVQLRLQDRLLVALIDQAKKAYEQLHNPLGLNDAFSEKIIHYHPRSVSSQTEIPTETEVLSTLSNPNCHTKDLQPLYTFYQNLAGIYRFKFGENQLGFLWDGKDHSEKYQEDWSRTFQEWTTRLCGQSQFVQSILDLTVFLPDNPHAHLAENRMNAVMLGLFEVKIHKQKGIFAMKVA